MKPRIKKYTIGRMDEVMPKELDEARTLVEQALGLCDSETADAIIGSPPLEEYGTLVRGIKAAYLMLWMMARGNGMRQTNAALTMGAQAMLMMATIVHYAYALGIKRGREIRDAENADERR